MHSHKIQNFNDENSIPYESTKKSSMQLDSFV